MFYLLKVSDKILYERKEDAEKLEEILWELGVYADVEEYEPPEDCAYLVEEREQKMLDEIKLDEIVR